MLIIISHQQMRLLISGYRNFHDQAIIEEQMLAILKDSPGPHTIIHGKCTGVDLASERIALKHKWNVESYPYIRSLGVRGGPVRNLQMIIEGNPDYALLFLSPSSKGTKNMLTLVEKYNISYTLVELI